MLRPAQVVHRSATSRCRRITLGRVDELRGSLCVAEVGRHIPFDIERAYWIFDVPNGGERANHAHREQSELLVSVRGSFIVHCDDGEVNSFYRLDSPDHGLLLPPMVFHRLGNFAPGSMCLVLSSGPYTPSEYINDYREFRRLHAPR
jgi:hypothetical protein